MPNLREIINGRKLFHFVTNFACVIEVLDGNMAMDPWRLIDWNDEEICVIATTCKCNLFVKM